MIWARAGKNYFLKIKKKKNYFLEIKDLYKFIKASLDKTKSYNWYSSEDRFELKKSHKLNI